jgi:DNA-binding MarR family transcriptional regulator
MVVDITATDLDLSLVSLFAGWAMADEIQRRIATEGHPELRFNDGVIFQHLLAAPLAISTLAERMGVTQQAASKAVADLERRGLVVRRPDPADARARLAELTERGLAAVESARAQRKALEAELTEEFGEADVKRARQLLAAIVTRFGAADAVRGRRVQPPR